MDAKVKSFVSGLHVLLANGSFDEHHIRTLLIDLRPFAKKGSALRELGDFIAHRDKEYGHIHEYVRQTIDALKAYAAGRPRPFTVGPVFTIAQLQSDLDAAFALAGLASLGLPVYKNVMRCVISLLQHVRLLDDKKNELATTELLLTSKELSLIATFFFTEIGATMFFNALCVENDFHDIPPNEGMRFSQVTTAACVDGKFVLKSSKL